MKPKSAAFKVRFDIDDDGKAYFMIGNLDVLEFKYTQPLLSSAMIYVYDFTAYVGAPININVTTFRLCKYAQPEVVKLTSETSTNSVERKRRDTSMWGWMTDVKDSVYNYVFGAPALSKLELRENDRGNRAKRYVTSVHKWLGDTITYRFVNYSSSLKQDGTRQAVLEAVTLYSNTIGRKFEEVSKYQEAKITLMFIKGNHADNSPFYGSGAVKAHAYSPVHSEIHFNDHETFVIRATKNNKGTDLFYTALHEIGHALGIKHSQLGSAAMHATYNPDNNAFNHDDRKALEYQYPGTKSSGVSPMDVNSVANVKYWSYQPKLPLPTECHKQIDAALAHNGYFYLIANAFVWKFSYDIKTKTNKMEADYPKRTAEIFPHWEQTTFAAFAGFDKNVYLIGEKESVSYKYDKKTGLFTYKDKKSVDSMFNKGTKYKIEPVLSAFTREAEKDTILVINAGLQYRITWAQKKISKFEKIEDPTKKLLTGADFPLHEFNAALEYTNYKKKTQTASPEVFRFGQTRVQTVNVFPGDAAPSLGYADIKDFFNIDGWCPVAT